MVKTPLYPFTIWLPKAHSDCVLAGSMLLAGIHMLALNLANCWKHLIIRSISRKLFALNCKLQFFKFKIKQMENYKIKSIFSNIFWEDIRTLVLQLIFYILKLSNWLISILNLLFFCIYHFNLNLQINRNLAIFRFFTTSKNKKNKIPIDLYYITDLAEAESSFYVGIIKNKKIKRGWGVKTEFKICLHIKDIELLKLVRSFFKDVGSFTILKKNESIFYAVQSSKDLNNYIISHFEKYSLLINRLGDFKIFKTVVEMICRKEHLTNEGLMRIVNLKASIHWGLSEELKQDLPNLIPISRPLNSNTEIKDPNWLVGFIEGEGCFYVFVYKSKIKVGSAIQFYLKIVQHSCDIKLRDKLVQYLGCGTIHKGNVITFTVTIFNDIVNIFLPFFNKYLLQGTKQLDFLSFYKIVRLMIKKAHLTAKGQNKIILIKNEMNTKRKYVNL